MTTFLIFTDMFQQFITSVQNNNILGQDKVLKSKAMIISNCEATNKLTSTQCVILENTVHIKW